MNKNRNWEFAFKFNIILGICYPEKQESVIGCRFIIISEKLNTSFVRNGIMSFCNLKQKLWKKYLLLQMLR